jgi:CRISPR-associated protein Cas2
MEILVCYDVNTKTAKGRKRLRRVAKTCQSYGQRAQKSVFECQLTLSQYEALTHKLLKIINEEKDSLRIYRLMEPRSKYLKHYGISMVLEMDQPLII